LLTVLANKLADTKNPTYLECLNRQANRFKNENWEALCNQDWPAGTPEGKHFDLQFCLHSAQGASYPLRALDFSGQNFRKLFANEQINQNREQLPENLRSLADYLQSAHIVVVLVNLTDFMDPPDAGTRSDNEWALKFCLDYLKSQRRRVCIALSQADRYRSTITSLGGPVGVVEKHLKEIYNAHIRDGHVQVFSIAAVADKVKVARTGEPVREVPAPGFSSEGIDDLVSWIAGSADALQQEELQEQQEQERARRQAAAETARRKSGQQTKRALSICAAVAVLLLLIAWAWHSVPVTPPLPPVQLINVELVEGTAWDNRVAHVKNNENATLYVTVTMHYHGGLGGDQTEDKSDYIQAGSAKTFEFRIWHPGQTYHSMEVSSYHR
jgi:hypothetical protein